MGRFRPREIRNDADLPEIRRQLNEIQKELASDLSVALASRKVTELQLGDYAAGYGDIARFGPPSTGARLILPEPNPARLGDDSSRVTAVVEAATGALTVEVINGTINGATTLVYKAGVGSVEFILTPDGWFAWSVSLVLSLPLSALASQASDTFVGNVSVATAVPSAVNLSTLAGAGLVFGTHTLDVTGSTSIIVGANDVQRAAFTSEVTAAQNVNALVVTRSTDFNTSPWTGNHNFEGQLLLGTEQANASTGAVNVTLGDVVRLRFTTAAGNVTVGTVSGCAEGRLLIVEFSGTGTHTITHDSATADAIACPGDTNLVITGRGGFIAVGRVGAAANWKVIATTN